MQKSEEVSVAYEQEISREGTGNVIDDYGLAQ
jgi:hypothetical protein